MDITTIIGIVGGFGLLVWGITIPSLGNFWDAQSLVIVVGGTITSVIASFPLSMLKNVGKHFAKLLGGKAFKPEPIIEQLVDFAQLARKNGLLALEEKSKELDDPFFKQGIMLVVDAMEADKVRELLEMELDSMIGRHEAELEIYEKAAAYAPAFGMIGTLVGLINMLKNMNLDSGGSSSIGEDMSVALITTFYGCVFANVILMPIAKKLRIRNEEEVLYKQIIIEGVLGIQSGDNPKNLKERLVSLLPQKKQMKIMDSEGGEAGGKGKKPKKEKKK